MSIDGAVSQKKTKMTSSIGHEGQECKTEVTIQALQEEHQNITELNFGSPSRLSKCCNGAVSEKL